MTTKRILSILICAIHVLSSFGFTYAAEEPQVMLLPKKQYEVTKQNFTTLDMSAIVNRGFSDDVAGDGKGGWTDQGAANDLSCFDLKGKVNLLGVDFNIIDPTQNDGKAALILRGQNDENYPISADIPVNSTAKGVYFLHAGGWISEGRVAGRYRFVYEDNTEYVCELIGNKNIFDWWGVAGSEYCQCAWSGSNSSSTVSLRMFACANPYPDKKIEKIVAETDGDYSNVMVVAATITDNGPFMPELENPNPDTSNWYPYDYPNYSESIGTALDVSFLLDAPAGKHGYIRAEGEDFIFEDGTQINFWGVNLAVFSMFKQRKEASFLAQALASQGINLVRFHGLDNNMYLNDSHKSRLRFDEGKVDQFCFLLSELKKYGIYYMIDIKVNKNAIFEDDNVAHGGTLFEESFFDPELIELKKSMAEALLTIYNPYTKMTVGEDPALVLVDIDNETSLVGGPGITNEYYKNQLENKFSAWLIDKYQTREKLEQAWADDTLTGLLPEEYPAKGNVTLPIYSARGSYSEPRQIDTMGYMMMLEYECYKEISDHIRSLGVKAPITSSTVWGRSPLSAATVNSYSDYIDFHTYWKHPHNGEGWLTGITFDGPESMITNTNLGMVGDCMRMKVQGLPFTISEWLSLAPNKYVSEQFPMMAAYMKLQNSNPMIYAYDFTKQSSNWESYLTGYDRTQIFQQDPFAMVEFPDHMASLPAAALMFHRDITEAPKGFYPWRYGENDVRMQKKQGLKTPWQFATIGKSGLIINEAYYDSEYNDNEVLFYAMEGEKTGRYVSITKEICLDRNDNVIYINTPTGQCSTGFIGGIPTEFDDIEYTINEEYATIFYQSVTDEPLWKSTNNLITVIGRAVNTGQKLTADSTAFEDPGRGPVLIQPITGDIVLKTTDDVKVYSLYPTGKRKAEIKTEKTKEGYTKLYLSENHATMHYEVVKNNVNMKKANSHVGFGEADYSYPFDDTDNNKKIETMYLLGYIGGDGERTFAPDKGLTRYEAICLAIGSVGVSGSGTDNFADVENDGSLSYNYLSLAKSLGIAKGDGSGNYNPDDTISRGNFAILAARSLNASDMVLKKVRSIDLSKYSDAQGLSDELKNAVTLLYNMGYMDFDGDVLNLDEVISRGEATEISYNIMWK